MSSRTTQFLLFWPVVYFSVPQQTAPVFMFVLKQTIGVRNDSIDRLSSPSLKQPGD